MSWTHLTIDQRYGILGIIISFLLITSLILVYLLKPRPGMDFWRWKPRFGKMRSGTENPTALQSDDVSTNAIVWIDELPSIGLKSNAVLNSLEHKKIRAPEEATQSMESQEPERSVAIDRQTRARLACLRCVMAPIGKPLSKLMYNPTLDVVPEGRNAMADNLVRRAQESVLTVLLTTRPRKYWLRSRIWKLSWKSETA